MFLPKDLFKAKNNTLVNNINDALIDLRNSIIKWAIPENENSNKIVDIIEQVLDFNKQQKGKKLPLGVYCSQLRILSPKQMLQKLVKVLTQVKAGNTSENLLNEIRQIMYFLYQEREVSIKVCNNILYSIKL